LATHSVLDDAPGFSGLGLLAGTAVVEGLLAEGDELLPTLDIRTGEVRLEHAEVPVLGRSHGRVVRSEALLPDELEGHVQRGVPGRGVLHHDLALAACLGGRGTGGGALGRALPDVEGGLRLGRGLVLRLLLAGGGRGCVVIGCALVLVCHYSFPSASETAPASAPAAAAFCTICACACC